jgi:plastocyanin
MKRLLTFVSALSLILIGCSTPPASPPADTAAPQATVEPTQPPPVATRAHTAEPATQAAPPTSTETATTAPTEAPTELPTSTPTQAPTATPGTVFVTYQDFEIVPSQITIPVGTTVVFLIKGGFLSFHQPYNFDPPNVFESPPNLGDGATWSYTFNEPGTVTIRCGYHSEMVATVIVTP